MASLRLKGFNPCADFFGPLCSFFSCSRRAGAGRRPAWRRYRNSSGPTRLGGLSRLTRAERSCVPEGAIRRRRLKRLWQRLWELQTQNLTRHELLLKLGAANADAGRAYRLVEVRVPRAEQPVNTETLSFALGKDKLRQTLRSEGHYLLCSNLGGEDPALLWQHYVQLSEVEAVFRDLKNDLAIRPIYHQKGSRIEAHVFVSFLAYCLYVTLRQRLRTLAPGLTP